MKTNPLLEQDDFIVFVPNSVDVLEKSLPAGSDIEDVRPIGGYCSTEHLDRQDEIVVAKGLDFHDFLNFGYFNDNHKQDTAAALGYPTKVELHKDKWWTEGRLFKGYTQSDRIWELAKAMAKSNAPRRLGFSIEGKITDRDHENRILRAMVRNVAITNCPVNTKCTWNILAKSFGRMDDVQRALKKAGAREVTGLSRDPELSYGEAMERLLHLRPNYSANVRDRIVRLAMR